MSVVDATPAKEIRYLKQAIKTTKGVGSDVSNATDSRKTHSQKQQVNIALMACDPKTYANAHDKPK